MRGEIALRGSRVVAGATLLGLAGLGWQAHQAFLEREDPYTLLQFALAGLPLLGLALSQWQTRSLWPGGLVVLWVCVAVPVSKAYGTERPEWGLFTLVMIVVLFVAWLRRPAVT